MNAFSSFHRTVKIRKKIAFYTFSLFGNIGLTQGTEPLTRCYEFQNLDRGCHWHYNNALSFSQIYRYIAIRDSGDLKSNHATKRSFNQWLLKHKKTQILIIVELWIKNRPKKNQKNKTDDSIWY